MESGFPGGGREEGSHFPLASSSSLARASCPVLRERSFAATGIGRAQDGEMKLAPIGEVGPEGEAGEGDAPRVAPHVGAGRDPARGFRDIADSCQQLPRCAATTRGRRERGDKGQRYAFSLREAACLHSGAEAAGFFSFQQGTDEGGIATSIPAVGRSPVHGGGLLLSPPNPCPPLPASRSGRSPPLRSRAAPSPPLRALSLTVFPPPSLLHPRLPFRPGRRGARPPPTRSRPPPRRRQPRRRGAARRRAGRDPALASQSARLALAAPPGSSEDSGGSAPRLVWLPTPRQRLMLPRPGVTHGGPRLPLISGSESRVGSGHGAAAPSPGTAGRAGPGPPESHILPFPAPLISCTMYFYSFRIIRRLCRSTNSPFQQRNGLPQPFPCRVRAPTAPQCAARSAPTAAAST